MDPYNQNPNMFDELQVTLEELAKAADNIVYIHQTMHSLKIFDLLQSKTTLADLLSSLSILEQVKKIDLDQISTLLQSPMMRKILTDPEFYQLFVPDTGATPGTQGEWYEQNKD